MTIPIIFGQPLHLWLGILLFLLVVFQILVAKHILPVPFKAHRVTGYIILVIMVVHGVIALGLYLGYLRY